MATTALFYETKSFSWKISNFAEVLKSKKMLSEAHFKFDMNLGVTTKAVLPLMLECRLVTFEDKGKKNKDRLGIFLYLQKVPQELSECHAKVRLQISSKEKGSHYLDDEFLATTASLKAGHGSQSSLPRFSKNPPFITADGALEARVTVTVYHPAGQNAELEVTMAWYESCFKNNFTKQLSDLRDHPLNVSSTATRIVSKDGFQFPVDRVILAARSPVFRAMFQSNLSEEQNGLVELKDLDSKPLGVLLHFIHTGELRPNWKEEGVMEGLLYGAHKYMMKDLLEFLDAILGMVCTKQNCAKLLGVAKTLKLVEAPGRLLDYFKNNLANNVDEVLRFAEETATAARLVTTQNPDSEESGEEPEGKKRKTDN